MKQVNSFLWNIIYSHYKEKYPNASDDILFDITIREYNKMAIWINTMWDEQKSVIEGVRNGNE